MRQEKWASLAASCRAGEVSCSLTLCHFPSREKSWGNKFSLGPELCCLRGLMQVNSNCFSCPLQCNRIVFLFFSGVLELLCWNTCTSTKALSSVGDCLKQCFPEAPGPWLRGVRVRVTAESPVGAKVCMPIQGGEGDPWHMALNPQLPQWGTGWGMSYSGMMLHGVGVITNCLYCDHVGVWDLQIPC